MGTHFRPLVSVIITNFNYARYLGEAIGSALSQSYRPLEVIVVDDGSTDESRDVITAYGSQIDTVFKPNGGQATAFNAGYAVSRGEIVLFLDADDLLRAHTVETVVGAFATPDVVKVHWPLTVIDSNGCETGAIIPRRPLPEGLLGATVLAHGPVSVASAPTSGNAWRRSFLDRVMPVPADVPYYRRWADEYLYTLAPVFGRICALADLLSFYRVHSRNNYSSRSAQEKLAIERDGHAEQCIALAHILARCGFDVNTAEWTRHSWFHHLDRALAAIRAAVPPGERFILIDDQAWGADELLPDRVALPFMQRNGEYWGAPSDAEEAITEIERQRGHGIRYVALGWNAFWWMNAYPEFLAHLGRNSTRVIDNADLLLFCLRRPQ
jgi:glycosyltransferase involved in cell wall biosynthesis